MYIIYRRRMKMKAFGTIFGKASWVREIKGRKTFVIFSGSDMFDVYVNDTLSAKIELGKEYLFEGSLISCDIATLDVESITPASEIVDVE
jgi:hypothetical protein